MDKTLNAFILAAGRGERLLPITNHIPKPLLPVLGKPVLQGIFEKVSALPVDTIGINLYHKKKILESWLYQSVFNETVRIFPEESLLGTGGALKNAEGFLGNGTFLVHNADIVSNIDLATLLEAHRSSKNLVTLAVHDCAEYNTLDIDKKGFLKGVRKAHRQQSGEVRQLAFTPLESSGRTPFLTGFTGIAVYEPEFLKFLPAGISSVVDAWLNAVDAGHPVGTLDVSGCSWSDIGTPSSYFSTVFHALMADGETLYIHPSITGCKEVILDGCVVIEKGSILSTGVSLKNCLILPGSCIGIKDNKNNPPLPPTIPPYPPLRLGAQVVKGGWGDLKKGPACPVDRGEGGLLIENCILGPGFKIDISESGIPGIHGGNVPVLIGTGGSDRKYFRVRKGKGTAVLMQCSDSDPDYHPHIEYTRFFLKHAVPAPELRETDPDRMTALFEDLGDISLYSWLKCPRNEEQIEEIYRLVINVLVLIHTHVSEHVSDCPLLQNRVFDYDHFRWETGYFVERFIQGIRNIRVSNPSSLDEEFHRLALKADTFPKTVIHRDFQSQNIMIIPGDIPRLIDYQGARMGPPGYDVASILWDPYYRLMDNMREHLLHYYIDAMIKMSGEKFREKDFRKTLLSCRLQRHMQALGAYGFLATVKRKKHFLKFIPEGLRLLKEALSLAKDEYPVLYDLVKKL